MRLGFPFGFEGRILDLIVSVPDHCLSFYFSSEISKHGLNTFKFKRRVNQNMNENGISSFKN